jgi:cobalt-zinc-cadmium efflux system outer membrane protein
MRSIRSTALALAGATLIVSGCVTADRGSAAVSKAMAARGAPPITWPDARGEWSADADARLVAEKIRAPITARRAVEIAFLRSPAIRATYAELGITQAEVLEASQVPSPTFSFARLAAAGNGGTQTTRAVSLSFADVLFLPARVRSAHASTEAARNRAAADLLALQGKVETSWYQYVSALEASRMRAAAAQAAEAAAEYARRLHSAGNISPRVLALENAAAAEASIAAARAAADAIEARAGLANLLALSTRDAWTVTPSLPALPALPANAEAEKSLVEAAKTVRLDLAADRQQVVVLEDLWRLSRWWRWFGDIDVGYERESETDGARIRGPTFSIGIPIFNWNRGSVLRAHAQLELARARLARSELQVRNDIALGLDRLASARQIAEAYRTALLPEREAATARTFEELNFMLSGAFEALQVKRQQYEAYGEYIAAVRDYWLARVQLRLATGGALADDDAAPPQDFLGPDLHGEHK